MGEREFFKAIAADGLSGAYYLYGREPYSRLSAIRQCKAIRAETARQLNVQTLSGAPAPEIINACETLPFFDEKRLVIVRELGGDDALLIADYTEKVPESTVLLIERAEPVKISALFKTLEARGRAIEFAPYDEDHAVAFLEKRARENDIRLERAAARQIVMMLGTDLAMLENTLLRLAGYAGGGGSVDTALVRTCVQPDREHRAFEILDPLIAGNKKAALALTLDMLHSGESAMGLAAYLEGAVRQLLLARQLLDAGYMEREAAAALGGNPYAAKQTVKKALRCSEKQLVEALGAFADVGYLQIQGRAKDADTLVLALLKCFQRPQSGTAALGG